VTIGAQENTLVKFRLSSFFAEQFYLSPIILFFFWNEVMEIVQFVGKNALTVCTSSSHLLDYPFLKFDPPFNDKFTVTFFAR